MVPAPAPPHNREMPLALGRHLLLRGLGTTGTVVFLSLLVLAVLAIRYWPPLATRIERWADSLRGRR